LINILKRLWTYHRLRYELLPVFIRNVRIIFYHVNAPSQLPRHRRGFHQVLVKLLVRRFLVGGVQMRNLSLKVGVLDHIDQTANSTYLGRSAGVRSGGLPLSGRGLLRGAQEDI
jgi:hypothetical protein